MTDQARRYDSAPPARGTPVRDPELDVAREIAEASLTATSVVEVLRLALDRVMPRVEASFAAVFLRDPADPDLLRVACTRNWPQASARFLSDFRVRVGLGPTGEAVAHGATVEVIGVRSRTSRRDWWEPARELGFASVIAVPLIGQSGVVGALSLYFADRAPLPPDSRALLDVVAHQLAATAEHADLITDLRSTNLKRNRASEALLAALLPHGVGERTRDA